MTLSSVIKRAPQPVIAAVLAAYQSAGDKQIKLTLIDVMGQVSASEALPVLRAGVKDADQDVARSAILALSAWMTPDPSRPSVARNDTSPTHQISAARVYQVIAAPSGRSRRIRGVIEAGVAARQQR
jgi:hypothetical protein